MEKTKIEYLCIDNFPDGSDLTKIMLPSRWIMYLYSKSIFKKGIATSNLKSNPYVEVCKITTLNDLIYILKIMELNLGDNKNSKKINLDANDYVIMREGISPYWEDPKNSNGGFFTIKIDHDKGYDIWSSFIIHIMGETITKKNQEINGISFSFLQDMRNNMAEYYYIKIWDSLPRSDTIFLNELPDILKNKLKNESIAYTLINIKKNYNKNNIKKQIAVVSSKQNVYEFRNKK